MNRVVYNCQRKLCVTAPYVSHTHATTNARGEGDSRTDEELIHCVFGLRARKRVEGILQSPEGEH